MHSIYYKSSEGVIVNLIGGKVIEEDKINVSYSSSTEITFSKEYEFTPHTMKIVASANNNNFGYAVYSGETQKYNGYAQWTEGNELILDNIDYGDTVQFTSVPNALTLTYQTQSTSPYRMLTDTDLLNWKWNYDTVGTNYPYATAFKNQMVVHSLKVRVSGSNETEFLNNLEHFVEVVDRDTRLQQKGRLYFGNYYIECLFTGCSKGKVYKKTYTTLELEVLAEDGDWKSEQDQSYEGASGNKWMNNYAVPTVSSNSENFEYGATVEITAVDGLRLKGGHLYYIDVSRSIDLAFFIYGGVSANAKYRVDNGQWVDYEGETEFDVSENKTVTISYDGSIILEYYLYGEPNATYIDWESGSGDYTPTFTLDLGAVTPLDKITGIGIGKGYTALGNDTVYLQKSTDGVTFTNLTSVALPTDDTINEFNYNPSGYFDARYLRVTCNKPFSVKSRTFKIEAHLTGEEQNLATSVICETENVTMRRWDVSDVCSFYAQSNGTTPHKLTFKLPQKTTVVGVGGVTVKNNRNYTDTVSVGARDFWGNYTLIGHIMISPYDTQQINFTNLELEECKQILFECSQGNFDYSASDFEILEEQTEAPKRYILNEHYVPSDAIIKIYGATNAPSILIGDNQYGAEGITLDDGEFLEINTKEETMMHYVDEDGWVNVFNHRLEDSFEKIPVGTSEITWSGNLQVDIKLLNARSDPKWN